MADLPDIGICYPAGANWLCAYTQEELDAMVEDPEVALVMARSDALAWSTLSSLTGYRLSLCPSVLRPCLAGCSPKTWQTAPVIGGSGTFSPYISNGTWYNGCGCSSNDCSCTSLCEVIMPSEVGEIVSVFLDGKEVFPSSYRVDDGRKLVRTDGECWPACQDMSKPGKVQYEPVVNVNSTNMMTFTREGQLVQVVVETTELGLTQGGNFAGLLPWRPKGGSQTTVYNSSGGQTGAFILNAGSPTINGSAGPAFATFRVVYETSAEPDPADTSGTFVVTYYPGVAPNDLFRYAAGVLAVEFYKACKGKDCRLPGGVTSISRAGISMEVQADLFLNGQTGIPEVDAVIRIYNPNALKGRPRVLSPDTRRGRIQTWG